MLRASPALPHRRRSRRALLSTALVGALVLPAPAAAQDVGRWLAREVPPDGTSEPLPVPTEEEAEAADAAVEATLAMAPDEQPASPDDPFAAVVEAEQQVADRAALRIDATARSDEANLASLLATIEQQEAQAAEDAAQRRRDAARQELEQERSRLSKLTVRAFVDGSDTEMDEYRALFEGDTSDAAGGRHLMFTQVLDLQEQVTDAASDALERASARLVAARQVLDDATVIATARAAEAAARLADRQTAERAHIEAIGDLDRAQRTLRTAGGGTVQPVPLDIAIIGMPRLSADDLAGWFARSGYRPRVATPIEDYAAWFIEEGAAEGIRGDIAFAQAVLETGGFANQDSVEANNFSGIGHCDSCDSGWVFPSPRMGVRAQIQLLKSYAVKAPEYAREKVDARLRGPAGCCQTWGDLTTVWATDPGYGPKVMLIYADIVAFALDRRAATPG